MIELKSNALDELEKSIQELANLNSKQILSKRDEQRQGSLMAIISGLKAGASVTELRSGNATDCCGKPDCRAIPNA